MHDIETITTPIRIDLWPDAAPGQRGPQFLDSVVPVGAVAGIDKPFVELRRPEHPNGASVIVLGGGGYRHIQMLKESDLAADLLLGLGVTVAVLHYRLPNDGWPAEAPVQDVQRTVRLLRARAAELGLDPGRVGVLGFSAGGHLAAMSATRFDFSTYADVDAADSLPARPDFAALIFPITTLLPPFDTTSTRRVLMADGNDPERLKAFSPPLHAAGTAPPTFIAHASDDLVADPRHSLMMFEALQAAGVPVEMHMFQNGGHGHAHGAPDSRFHLWQGLFASWVAPHIAAPATKA
ncbi:MAG TPA: alpha/beta hydrolase [Devosiaceae bacterium]|jgi:acetyl esterase/lipase